MTVATNLAADDLRIPMPAGAAPISASYRARRVGPEPQMRIAMFAAAGLGGLLLIGMGGWAMMGRRPATVPVIEADSRPLRVKPENPGGMQIAGADEVEANDSNNRMAPSAEAPAPQALRAQMQQGVAATASAGVVAGPAAVAAGPVSPGVSPLPDTPARVQPAARVAAPAVAARPAAGGGTQVQLAAVETEALAQSEWQRLAKRMPDLLGDRKLSVQRADREGHAVWRVRTGGFADVAEATGFCTKVRAKGGACAIASF